MEIYWKSTSDAWDVGDSKCSIAFMVLWRSRQGSAPQCFFWFDPSFIRARLSDGTSQSSQHLHEIRLSLSTQFSVSRCPRTRVSFTMHRPHAHESRVLRIFSWTCKFIYPQKELNAEKNCIRANVDVALSASALIPRQLYMNLCTPRTTWLRMNGCHGRPLGSLAKPYTSAPHLFGAQQTCDVGRPELVSPACHTVLWWWWAFRGSFASIISWFSQWTCFSCPYLCWAWTMCTACRKGRKEQVPRKEW